MQRRSLTMWLTLAASAIAISNAKTSEMVGIHLSPKLRAAVLSFAFPGAGYIACANLVGGGLFLLTWLLMPVALFAWFGAGAVSMPLGLWVLSVAGAYLAASSTGIFNWAGLVAGALVASAVIYFNRLSARERIAANKKRDVRNEYLPQELATMADTATSNSTDEDRELSLEELRRFQFILEVGSQPIDDFSNYTVIDQFQTSAIRYQMYELMYVLGMYQVIFAPNFHGYSAQIYRQLIEKSLTQRVMGFWKWETLFGKFSTNYEPVYEDNIMVSGWLLQALALYTGNTGDMRYTEPGSLRFQIDKTHIYEHDIHSLSKSVVDQWDRNPYTLFPCEPNWIYSICNMQGWLGQVVYDRVFGSTHTKRLGQRYETSLLTEFGEPDGSIVPIRSELTGFSIPGLCGALSDLCNAIFCRGHMDHIARRIWAIFRHENIRIDQETGEMNLIGMVGADKIDPGTYKPSPYSMYPLVALTAGEFGDEEIRLKALAKLQKAQETIVENTGSVHQSQEHAGFSMNTSIMKAHMLRQGDWKRVVSKVSFLCLFCTQNALLLIPNLCR